MSRANSDALAKIEQQRIKLEEKLKALKSDVARETEKLKFQIRDLIAEYKRQGGGDGGGTGSAGVEVGQ
jgi:hypothetical protein